MGMNETASSERLHIGFFGLRNAGKSSVVNAVTGQDLALVSDTKGTTTDPVKKAMELLPLGPVVIIDTPGMDDEGPLGELRVQKARRVLEYTDIAVLVVDALCGMQEADKELTRLFDERKIPYVIAFNKADLTTDTDVLPGTLSNTIFVSARTGQNIYELKELIAKIACQKPTDKRIVADLLDPGDVVLLVVPIDSAAPKGRLILPQQQTIRDALEAGASVMITRETELPHTLDTLFQKPKLVITDSQVFEQVAKNTPGDIPLTSFSILFARYKGDLEAAVKGAVRLDHLKDGDRILISEGCTHHRQCDDIGTVKMPRWVTGYAASKNGGKAPELLFEFTSGTGFPEDLSPYSLIIHCGGCMLNEREMQYRIRRAGEQGIPMTNYGIAIAQMHGILRRSLDPFPQIQKLMLY